MNDKETEEKRLEESRRLKDWAEEIERLLAVAYYHYEWLPPEIESKIKGEG